MKKSKTAKNPRLAAALAYAERGWPVMPLHGIRNRRCTCSKAKCSSPGKHPRTPHGLKDATTDATQIRKWWRRWPDANVGIATGAAAGLVVLDVDPRHGGTESLAAVVEEHGPLPGTVVANTGGGGQHHYLAHSGGEAKCRIGALGDGLDLKADGGYVVAPPSRHASGARYEWEVGPDEVKLAAMPSWLQPKRTKKVARKRTGDQVFREGQRNDRLMSIAGAMRRQEADHTSILAALQAINAKQCSPPLSIDEVREIAASASRYTPEGKGNSAATRLIRALSNIEVFHSPEKVGFARIEVNGHFEHYRIRSSSFRDWLQKAFWDNFAGSIASTALEEVVSYLAAKAIHSGDEHRVAVRVAGDAKTIWVDLCDAEWRAVKITKSGWEIVAKPPARFIRTGHMAELPAPERGGSVEDFRRFVNVRDHTSWVLVLSWLVNAFNPERGHPVLVVTGEQGGAKSTLCRMLSMLVDPSQADLRSPPRGERELAIACANSWLLIYDNLSTIKVHLSDALCRIATGGSLTVRSLYTDGDETVFSLRGPLVLNGIGKVVSRGDLLDRSFVLTLDAIPAAERKTEEDLWADFLAARPAIMGALLDAVSEAIRRRHELVVKRHPRMADSFRWAVAAAPALGLSPSDIQDAYDVSQETAAAIIAEGHPIFDPLMSFMSERTEWQGTTTQLLTALRGQCHKVLDGDVTLRRGDWPQSALHLSNDLGRLRPTLRRLGISVSSLGKRGKRGDRILRVAWRRAEKRSPVSPVPPAKFAKQPGATKKRLTKKKRKAGGTGGTGGQRRTTLGQGDDENVYEL